MGFIRRSSLAGSDSAQASEVDAPASSPAPIADALLRLAETELYDVRWSDRILDGVVRNLIADDRATADQARA